MAISEDIRAKLLPLRKADDIKRIKEAIVMLSEQIAELQVIVDGLNKGKEPKRLNK